MSRDQYPAVEYVLQCFREENGKLFWRQRPRGHFRTQRGWRTFNSSFVNQEAGCLGHRNRKLKRWMVNIGGTQYPRYNIVWAIHTGEWPCGELDHRDRNSLDDRIENLRIATESQNQANRAMDSDNTAGFKGVSWEKSRSRWRAAIKVKGKCVKLGRFDDIRDAAAAYDAAALKYFGEFACLNNPMRP